MYLRYVILFMLDIWVQYAISTVAEEEYTTKKFKLSDLPVLKKWEIPNHHFTQHVGRKYKDLERETKRSTYWEPKPDFTASELEWDEDPEKIKLDFNYKGFLEEDEEHDIERSLFKDKTHLASSPIVEVTGDKRSLHGNLMTLTTKQEDIGNKKGLPGSMMTLTTKDEDTGDKKSLPGNMMTLETKHEVTGDKRSLHENAKTLVPKHKGQKRSKKHVKKTKKHKISRRSLDVISSVLNHDEEFLHGLRIQEHKRPKRSILEDERPKRNLIEDERIKRSLLEVRDGEEEDDLLFPSRFFMDTIEDGDEIDNEIRERRAAIWDAVRKLQLSQGEQQNIRRNNVQQKPLLKRPQKHEIVHYPTPLIQHKTKSNIPVSVLSKRSHIMLPRLPVATETNKEKKTQRNVIERHKKSGELGDEQIKRNKIKIAEHLKSTRQNIDRPDTIDPSNVARAVSMAMEQLKRDKMWGKVFVHVKPNGQLKVMVQETKKMDDN